MNRSFCPLLRDVIVSPAEINMTPELIEKYLQQQCTPEEQTAVEYWLLRCKPGELDEVLVKIWNEQEGVVMPEELERRLIKQIPVLAQRKKKVIQLNWRHAVAAALLAGIFFLAGRQWATDKDVAQPISETTTPQKNAMADSLISNRGESARRVILPDGSAVTLYPHASVRYPAAYNIKDREIILTGKAIFTVAKDKHRPFTVYARQLATTALGTQFLVDASSISCVQVKLYEGRILVKSAKEQHILTPGDSLVYSDLKGSLLLKRVEKNSKRDHASPNEKRRTDTLHFVQTPLEEVFAILAKEYGTTIQFKNDDLKGMNFTGEVSMETSLSKVIRLIAEMNGLHCQSSSKGYTISSK